MAPPTKFKMLYEVADALDRIEGRDIKLDIKLDTIVEALATDIADQILTFHLTHNEALLHIAVRALNLYKKASRQ